MLNKETVLVTGGAGYIGAHACKALLLAGYTPVTVDNLVYGHERAVKWGPFERGDIGDSKRIKEIIVQHNPVAVMHFAAYAYVGESILKPSKYYNNNVVKTLSLLDEMREHNIRYFVFSSTCATYGNPQSLPITETHVQNPINSYGASKLMIERILADYDSAYSLKYCALRYFNAAGADPDTEIGEDHNPETHLIPLILDVVNNTRSYIEIFGADYDTPDGTCIRDYIHVTDLANAHVLALQKLINGNRSSAYNLGNGNGFSVMEVIKAARDVTGKEINEIVKPRRFGDPPILVGDSGKAKKELGWQPKHDSLFEIIETAWKWHRTKDS